MGLQHVGMKLCPANGAFCAGQAKLVEIGRASAFARLPFSKGSAFWAPGETPDDARKSRIFNNLEGARGNGRGGFFPARRPSGVSGPRIGGSAAILILVE